MSIDLKLLTGREILDEAARLNVLADKAAEDGNYELAERLSQRALCIKETELGANHPQIAIDVLNVGLLCQALGNYGEAFALVRRALLIQQSCFGLGHPTVLETQNVLAELLDEIDEFAYFESPYSGEFAAKGA